MEIQSKNTKTNGYFKAVENGEEAGVMTYKWSEVGEMIIKNTTVHKAFKGKGIGSQLVMAAVQYARENHI